MIKVSKEKWKSIGTDYKRTWNDYQGKHPEWIGRQVVMGACVSDDPQDSGALLVEGVHFVIEE